MMKLSLLQKVGKFSLLVNFVRKFQILKVREKRGFRSSSLLSTQTNQGWGKLGGVTVVRKKKGDVFSSASHLPATTVQDIDMW